MVSTLKARIPESIRVDGLPLLRETGKPWDLSACLEIPLWDRASWIRLAKSLRGQFAIVVTECTSAVVITDLTGCCPVFRLKEEDGQSWKFATSLAELEPASKRRIRRSALMQYVAMCAMDTTGGTIFSDIDRVPGGSVAFYSGGREEVTEYAEWTRMSAVAESDADEAADRLEAEIRIYTDAIMGEEKPSEALGILLSGGTDSTLLAALLRKSYEGRLRCFTQNFRFARYSELAEARVNALSLGLVTEPVMLRRADHMAAVRALNSRLQDQPCASVQSMNLWGMLSSASVHCKNFMVGEHADSLFLGFDHFFLGFPADSDGYLRATNALTPAQKLGWARPQQALSDLDAALLETLEVRRNEYREWFEDYAEKRQARLAAFSGRHLTTVQQLDGQIGGGLSWQRTILPVLRSLSGIRVLTPFFDNAVIEMALGLAASLKYRNGSTKFLLRQTLRRHLGREIAKRPAGASPVAIWRLMPSLAERSQITAWLRPYYDRVSGLNLISAGRLANQQVKTAALGIWMNERKL